MKTKKDNDQVGGGYMNAIGSLSLNNGQRYIKIFLAKTPAPGCLSCDPMIVIKDFLLFPGGIFGSS
jgi:hypothetical protein